MWGMLSRCKERACSTEWVCSAQYFLEGHVSCMQQVHNSCSLHNRSTALPTIYKGADPSPMQHTQCQAGSVPACCIQQVHNTREL